MDIEFAVIPSSALLYDPVLIPEPGQYMLLPPIEEEVEVFRHVVAKGHISGHPIVLYDIYHGTDYFQILVPSDESIELEVIESEVQVFSPSVYLDSIRLPVIDSTAHLYAPEIRPVVILPIIVDSWLIYSPIVHTINDILLPDIPEDTAYFTPSIERGTAIIEFDFDTDPLLNPTHRLYNPTVQRERLHPLRFKAAETVLGGRITPDNIASLQEYIQVDPDSAYDSRQDFLYTEVSGLLPNYIPAHDATFSKTIYRAFYIMNDSPNDTRRNIDFWINGGETYVISNSQGNKRVNEGYYPMLAATMGEELENADEVLLGGTSRTSLFNNVEVSYLIVDELLPVSESGVGVGINLNTSQFTPGNIKTRIRDLEPQDYVGVYLRIRSRFNPDIPVDSDYAFLHLEYTSERIGYREKYPGQLHTGLKRHGTLLPSVSLRFKTGFSGLKRYLDSEVDAFYNKYPPYFIHYEEISE